MSAVLLLIIIIGLMLVGVPVAIALGLSSTFFLMFLAEDPKGLAALKDIALNLFEAFHGHSTLLAIPYFIFASTFMATGGIAKRIIRFAIAIIGHFRGGLAMASVLACMIFAALSGSSPATVVAIGSLVIPGMIRAGYTKEFAAGVICNAGTLGILIPPSIVMVVYASVTDVSVSRMFIAGIIPGLLAGTMLMIGIYIAARFKDLPTVPWTGWKEVFLSGMSAFWGLLLIVIILGGIYGGIFTETEAAAVSAVYAFFVTNFFYRDIGPFSEKGKGDLSANWISLTQNRNSVFKSVWLVVKIILKVLWRTLSAVWHPDNKRAAVEAGKLTIMLMFIIANALILKHVITTASIPEQVTNAMISAGFGVVMFLIIVNLILLIGGQFMEPSGLLLIVTPLVFPIALKLGIDPIHLGIIMVVNMEIGMITPPVGLNLFVTSGVAKMSVGAVVKAALPWAAILFVFLIIVTYVPALSTWLYLATWGPQPIL